MPGFRLIHEQKELSMITRGWSRFLSPLALTFALLLALNFSPSSARADFVLSVGNIRQITPNSGSFEVSILNTGLQAVGVAGFTIELMLPASSGVSFTGVTTGTVANPYLFAGTGIGSIDPLFQFSDNTFPNVGFIASDVEFVSSSILVSPAATFGLGLVTYAIGPNITSGTVPINFVTSGTSLSDQDGNAIAFSIRDGSIQFNAVPEPSSSILLTISLATIAFARNLQAKRPVPLA